MCQIADWIMWAMLLVCGIFDWRKKEIPVVLLIGMSIVTIVFFACAGRDMLWSRVAGGGLGLLLFALGKWSKEAIGYGDCWIILLLGIYVGLWGVCQVLFVAFAIAGVTALFCLWFRRWNRKMTLPFIPFLVFSYLGVVCL